MLPMIVWPSGVMFHAMEAVVPETTVRYWLPMPRSHRAAYEVGFATAPTAVLPSAERA
jgi:hypothetical protein